MDTRALERFAQAARRQLHEQVAAAIQRVLAADSVEQRSRPAACNHLRADLAAVGRDAVVERAAYTWFNRFCALRFMDVNGYSRVGIVSPQPGFTQPEILQEAKQGHIDDDLPVDRARVFDLLAGRTSAPDAQSEAYRLLLLGGCNRLHSQMPFLFDPIAAGQNPADGDQEYTDLLMPDDLLSAGSILQAVRDAMTPAACQDVEVIGWLYQYYISEKKDAVIGSKSKIAAADIPAATQLFTPHWIVRYLVENSLGRLWLLNRPNSKLAEQMPYYIAPATPETDTLRVASPEEITVCDPAVGSGHMLTYAFDLLYAIYAEEGYNPVDIPRLILEKNLYGMEIDKRAGDLAAFALMMKARGRDRRFFSRRVQPHITVYRPITVTQAEVQAAPWLQRLARDLLGLPVVDALLADLHSLQQIDLVGSLLRPQLTPEQIDALLAALDAGDDLFSHDLHQRLRGALAQLAALARRYHVVVANPPYMGGKSFDDDLKDFAQSQYPDSKSDLFAMFMQRNLDLARDRGLVAMITMQSWMFLSSFEALRARLLQRETILGMAHLGPRAFDSIGGEVVSTTAFVLGNAHQPEQQGDFVRLVDGRSEAEKAAALQQAIADPACGWFYRAAAADFAKIPGSPIAYWVSEALKATYDRPLIGESYDGKEGVGTRNDEFFMRMFWEVSKRSIARNRRWILTDKAGDYRRWYMGFSYLMDWEQDGLRIRNYRNEDGSLRSRPQNIQYLFMPGVTWGKVGSGIPSFRWRPAGFGFNDAAPTIFGDGVYDLLAALNSNVTRLLLGIRGGTLNITVGVIHELPNLVHDGLSPKEIRKVADDAVALAHADWDSYETSWDFADLPLLRAEFRRATLADTYAALRAHWQAMTDEMQRLEEENNRLFIDAYGLQDELTPDVPRREITLTCNPAYRYGDKRSDDELEALLLADTLRELISYAVGCMFGRYSLDKPGLILANQGDTVEEYTRQVPQPTLAPDADNVLPILDGDWFTDDIVGRFQRFLRVTFGEERYSDNLAFIEQALGRDLRSYFLREFYDDHVKRYQKRPIYWLFSSPKGSFNALISMHRYRPDTVSLVLNEYLREFRAKLQARKAQLQHLGIRADTPAREKTAALKEIDKIDKTLKELDDYENDVLYPLATQQIAIDLDDGVKVNYAKFGPALKKIAGL